MQRAMFATVDEIERVVAKRGHRLRLGARRHHRGRDAPRRTGAAPARARRHRSWGFGDDDYRWLAPDEARAAHRLRPNLGALFTPHCAAIHPAKLARGLAAASSSGSACTIYEHTPVDAIEPRAACARRTATCAPTSSSARPRRSAADAPRPAARARADLLADDRDRAAARRVLGRRRARASGRRSPTSAT